MNSKTARTNPRQGAVIRAARKASGLSQREVGEHLGVSATAVGHWERGMLPLPGHARALAPLLGLDWVEPYIKGVTDDEAPPAGAQTCSATIKRARLDARLSKLQLARLIDVSDRAVSGWEDHGQIPDDEAREALEAVLLVDLSPWEDGHEYLPVIEEEIVPAPRARDFGGWLKREREARGLTQAEVARALAERGYRVGRNTVGRWERGDARPRRAAVAVLEDLWGRQERDNEE